MKKNILIFSLISLLSITISLQADFFQISKNIDIFIAIYKEINKRYVESVTPHQLMNKGIRSMLNSLDPYTEYYPESEIENYKMRFINDSYGGVGISVAIRDNKIVVMNVFQDSPAAKQGIWTGDEIIAINDTAVDEENIVELSKTIKGGRATKVNLKINRASKQFDITLERDKINFPSIRYATLLKDKFVYIRLDRFIENSSKEVLTALQKYKQDYKGIILDLRNNGGGLLNEAVSIVNLFIHKGVDVVYQKGKNNALVHTYKTTKEPFDTQSPLVVLINQYSASASEIVSGALQDLDRAVIVGRKSFGKALVQQTVPLPYNGLLKVTVSRYFTPSGRCLQNINYAKYDKKGKHVSNDKQLVKPYLTKKKRKIFNQGGVAPDLFIPNEKNLMFMSFLLRNYFIFDFSNNYRLKNQAPASPEGFSITEKNYNNFINFVLKGRKNATIQLPILRTIETLGKQIKQQNQDQLLKEYELLNKKSDSILKKLLLDNKEYIAQVLSEEIIERYFYQKEKIAHSIHSDQYILKTLPLLDDEKLYQEVFNAKGVYASIGKLKEDLDKK